MSYPSNYWRTEGEHEAFVRNPEMYVKPIWREGREYRRIMELERPDDGDPVVGTVHSGRFNEAILRHLCVSCREPLVDKHGYWPVPTKDIDPTVIKPGKTFYGMEAPWCWECAKQACSAEDGEFYQATTFERLWVYGEVVEVTGAEVSMVVHDEEHYFAPTAKIDHNMIVWRWATQVKILDVLGDAVSVMEYSRKANA